MVFGCISLYQSRLKLMMRVTMGWTLGEEVLFDSSFQVRNESAQCDRESCVLKISRQKLTQLLH